MLTFRKSRSDLVDFGKSCGVTCLLSNQNRVGDWAARTQLELARFGFEGELRRGAAVKIEGIAAVEAMAAGLPVVLGEGVAIAADVARGGGGIVVGPEPQSIADGLRRIISDNSARQAMGRKARQLAVERYSIDAMGANLKQLYTDILKRTHELPGSR